MNITTMTEERNSGSDVIGSCPTTIVVMGDALTGKSALIKSLSSDRDYPIFRIDDSNDSISSSSNSMKKKNKELRLLEFHSGYEDSVAPNDVALVVITFDIRVQESFHRALDKWLKIKNERMTDSMLLIVGNFLDSPIERRVEVVETCRACAKKDALYFEISNETMENVRELHSMVHDLIVGLTKHIENSGKINHWENHEYEQVDLKHIEYHLQNLKERLEDTENDLRHPSTTISNEYNSNNAYDRQHIQEHMFESFKALGLSVPHAMLTAPLSTPSLISLNAHHHKIRISLPGGMDDVTLHIYDNYDLETQIDAFMKIYEMSGDRQARDRILSIATMLINKKAVARNSGIENNSSSNKNRAKTFKYSGEFPSSDE